MLKNRLFHLSWLSLGILIGARLTLETGGAPFNSSPVSPTSRFDLPNAADSKISPSPAAWSEVPDQGRPVGRLRGGSSR